jgi:hypothetical protein
MWGSAYTSRIQPARPSDCDRRGASKLLLSYFFCRPFYSPFSHLFGRSTYRSPTLVILFALRGARYTLCRCGFSSTLLLPGARYFPALCTHSVTARSFQYRGLDRYRPSCVATGARDVRTQSTSREDLPSSENPRQTVISKPPWLPALFLPVLSLSLPARLLVLSLCPLLSFCSLTLPKPYRSSSLSFCLATAK